MEGEKKGVSQEEFSSPVQKREDEGQVEMQQPPGGPVSAA